MIRADELRAYIDQLERPGWRSDASAPAHAPRRDYGFLR
jgi:hypothetical protein